MALKLYLLIIFCNAVFSNARLFGKIHPPIYRHDNISDKLITTRSVSTDLTNFDSDSGDIDAIENITNIYTDETTVTIATTIIEDELVTVKEPIAVKNCTEGQSYFVENDLKLLIDYFTSDIKLIENINGSYSKIAMLIRDKHEKTLNDFFNKLENRPKHLDHIISDMAEIRVQNIEPLVKEITFKLPELTSLNAVYNQKLNDSNNLFFKLENSIIICELNCDSVVEQRSIMKRNKRSFTGENFYCATLDEVTKKIKTDLKLFENEYTNLLMNSLQEIDKVYFTKIEELKLEMKEAAVQKFGMTMFDVLSLEDEYYHLVNELKGSNSIDNVESKLSSIRKNNLEIDYKIGELKNSVETYRKHCLNCNNKDTSRFRRDVKLDYSLSDPTSILEELLNQSRIQIINLFQNYNDTIFENINNIVNDKDTTIQNQLTKLEHIQNAITEKLTEEEQRFYDLKIQAPESILNDLSELYTNSIFLLQQLDDALKFIEHSNI